MKFGGEMKTYSLKLLLSYGSTTTLLVRNDRTMLLTTVFVKFLSSKVNRKNATGKNIYIEFKKYNKSKRRNFSLIASWRLRDIELSNPTYLDRL